MLFSATWPREIQALAFEFLRTPVQIKFGVQNQLNANKDVTQIIKMISEGEKSDTLMKVIAEINPEGAPEKIPKTIVFVSRKHSCDSLANDLWNAGYSVDSLHGDKQQVANQNLIFRFSFLFYNSLFVGGGSLNEICTVLIILI